MASFGEEQTWVPYDTSKDCSLGICSHYCPQWCYVVFPPPPPLYASSSSSASAFSPLVIAIMGILAGAFLLVTYYTVISRYCTRFHRPRPPDPEDPPARGMEEALIGKISVYKYQRGDGVVDGADCTVCLGEFRDEERLRLLPRCGHAFHLPCIDAWLRSSPNCPLCRADIVPLVVQLPPPPPPPAVVQPPPPDEIKESVHVVRRSASMVSIADVLRARAEDAAGRRHGRGRERGLHGVMSTVHMKRSSSSSTSARFGLGFLPHQQQ